MSKLGQPYKLTFSIQNRPPESSKYLHSQFRQYGLIKPKDDPGLDYSDDLAAVIPIDIKQLAKLNEDCKRDTKGFMDDCHLPKGVFDPTKRKFDPSKKTLVINYVEDKALPIFLKALAKYFQLAVPEVQSIRDEFNIFVTWSTSLEDALKTLKIVGEKINGFTKASVLFLNTAHLNMGTGPNFSFKGFKPPALGAYLPELAKKIFNITSSKTITQTADRSKWNSSLNGLFSCSAPKTFKLQNTIIGTFAKLFKQANELIVGKLSDAIDQKVGHAENVLDIPAVHILIQSFLKHLHAKRTNKTPKPTVREQLFAVKKQA